MWTAPIANTWHVYGKNGPKMLKNSLKCEHKQQITEQKGNLISAHFASTFIFCPVVDHFILFHPDCKDDVMSEVETARDKGHFKSGYLSSGAELNLTFHVVTAENADGVCTMDVWEVFLGHPAAKLSVHSFSLSHFNLIACVYMFILSAIFEFFTLIIYILYFLLY